ncbi:MAG: hypothetical protein ABL871_19780 [Terricaulis sp.]
MRHLFLIATCALLPFNAFAQEPAATAPAEVAATTAASPYAVPVESLEIGGARARLMESGGSAGGYSIIVRTTTTQTSFLTRDRGRITLNYRFTGAEEVELLSGVCELKTEGRSYLGFSWDQRTTQLYACEARDQAEGVYALEVTFPGFSEAGFSNDSFGVSVGGDDASPEAQAILAARLSYEGVAYEAAPTSFSAPRLMAPDRIVLGYVISRDGQPVGRVDFRGNSRNRGTIIAPVADADGRRAVLYMALQLLAMPDFYSSNVRATLLDR